MIYSLINNEFAFNKRLFSLSTLPFCLRIQINTQTIDLFWGISKKLHSNQFHNECQYILEERYRCIHSQDQYRCLHVDMEYLHIHQCLKWMICKSHIIRHKKILTTNFMMQFQRSNTSVTYIIWNVQSNNLLP